MFRRAALLTLALGACGPELNPARPPPAHDELATGGVWVAYNLGCEVGCDQIRRGDRILAIDDRPVTSGAEIDAIGLTRDAPIKLRVVPHRQTTVRDITIVASPRDDLPPIKGAPPLFTVGAAALDRAPAWARQRMFGHAIPALRLYRADDPRGFLNGRELYGRAAVIVVWEFPPMIDAYKRSYALVPSVYAHLQQYADTLLEAGVDTYFVTKFRAEEKFRDHARSLVPPSDRGVLPIFQLSSNPNNPNTLGIEGAAADVRETLRDYSAAPVVLVIDRRGIVRFHARGFPVGAHDTIAVALDFALKALVDAPTPPGAAPLGPIETPAPKDPADPLAPPDEHGGD